MKTQVCEHCGNIYTPSRGPCKSRRQRFCSKSCRGKAICGERHHLHKGGYVTRDGYRMISVEGKRVLEHRSIMEQHLGRALCPGEVVHHKNGNKLDNRLENLEVIASQAEHASKHSTSFRSETHRQCTACGEVKERSEFHRGAMRARPGRDRSHPHCRNCRAAYYAQRYREGKTTVQKTVAKGPPYAECVLCHKTTHRICSQGRCTRCYAREYYKRTKL